MRKTVVFAALAGFASSMGPGLSHGPNDPPHQLYRIGDLKLEGGETVKDFAISCVTHGTLN